jgi:hypothetical protein
MNQQLQNITLLSNENLQRITKLQEDKVKMDYQSELKKLQEGSDYWKPKVGQFRVKALTELEPAEPFVQRRSDGTEESHEQYKLGINIAGENKIWTFGKGKTPASTYGQLVEFASKNNNTLVNVEFAVVVKSDGSKNDYTIVQ